MKTYPNHQLESRPATHAAFPKLATALSILAIDDEVLLIARNAQMTLDFKFEALNCVIRLRYNRDSLTVKTRLTKQDAS